MKLVRPSKGAITSGYGKRSGGVGSTNHKGLDFGWGNGWDIYAAATGTVTFAGWVAGYGNLTKIRHPLGYETRYAHQSKINVHVKQKVAAGQKIGVKGNTGTSSGSHLHFELRLFGVPIDPTNKFTAPASSTTPASDTVTTITEQELDMSEPRYVHKTEMGEEFMVIGVDVPGGWYASTHKPDGEAMGVLHGQGNGAPWITNMPYAKWQKAQALAKKLNAEKVAREAKAADELATKIARALGATAGTTDTKPLLAAIAGLPDAVVNGIRNIWTTGK